MKCPFCIKVCTKCKRLLVAYKGNFGKQKNGKYGFVSQCKKCKNEYYENNKEHHNEVMKQWRKNNWQKKAQNVCIFGLNVVTLHPL